jgi:hypothetical protein
MAAIPKLNEANLEAHSDNRRMRSIAPEPHPGLLHHDPILSEPC